MGQIDINARFPMAWEEEFYQKNSNFLEGRGLPLPATLSSIERELIRLTVTLSPKRRFKMTTGQSLPTSTEDLATDINHLFDRDWCLRLVSAVVTIVQSQAVPVHRPFHIAIVTNIDNDLRALLDSQSRARNGTVVGEHPNFRAANVRGDGCNPEVESLAVGQFDNLRTNALE